MRGARRFGGGVESAARALLATVSMLPVETSLLEVASVLAPPAVRSLDAIHLASALSIRDDLTAFVAYDLRLIEAARDRGLPVVSPGT